MNELIANPVQAPLASRRKPNPWLVRAVLLVFALIAAGAVVFGAWLAVCPEIPLAARVLGGLLAAGFAFLWIRILVLAVRRKIRTGQWHIGPEERERLRSRTLARMDSPSSKFIRSPAFSYSLAVPITMELGVMVFVSARRGHLDRSSLFMIAVLTLAAANQWLMGISKHLKLRKSA